MAMQPMVAILILNYHQPEVTLACVRRLMEREGSETRILWLENDAQATHDTAVGTLKASGLPWVELDPEGNTLSPAGIIGYIPIQENRGYAGGNNVGARLCQRCDVPFVWIMNNDTLLESGTSTDLVNAAKMRPEIGVWGTTIRSREGALYAGGQLRLRNFSIQFIHDPEIMENDLLAFVSGCSLFFATNIGSSVGFLDDNYFLYYEDPAFTLELRKAGWGASLLTGVEIFHEESLSTGRRSPFMEYYNRRNRWYFIQRYFPEHLGRQKRFALYRFQSLLFRGAISRVRLEWLALWDWHKGRMGMTTRNLPRKV